MDMTVETHLPAEIYDERFVPALFGQWGETVSGVAGIGPGAHVLDVACGTGALALAAAKRAGPSGKVTGIDINPDMLAVARRKETAVNWVDGAAEDLPFDDACFDAVVSQFGFMFFEDRGRALAEMKRVVRPGGAVAVAVCGDLERSPGYAAFAALLDRLFGPSVGDAFRAPFVLGDIALMENIAAAAGYEDARVAEYTGTVRFPSIGDLVTTERACVWTLGGVLDDDQFAHLQRESQNELRPFVQADGSLVFDMPALILASGAAVHARN